MANFRLEIVTPSGKIYSNDVEFVLVRTTEGDMGILANHSPFVAGLAVGEMIVREEKGKEIPYYVSGGFLEINSNKVIVLVDEAMLASEIDLENARKEAAFAEEKLKKLTEDKNIILTQKSLHEALVKVSIAEKLL
ncbi:ATP synthase F1 subunit epsilon [Fusobacterium perfoetens]|uniref:ATP synthase F1 subunit epsilon n=1 Tax=Fusobacterium perfoetens TaxID=852 RepID=UPI0015A3DEF2|nr:ATP synthase F1 subunit epsilon [Fusobacterium perfoetens]MCF2626411.1 ATP synthase F1 subunit epsilon [Fusobacterium perfoetens]